MPEGGPGCGNPRGLLSQLGDSPLGQARAPAEGQSPGRTEPGPRAQKRGPSLGGALSRAVQPAGSYAVLCCILKIYIWLTVLLQGQGPQLETAVLGAESQEGTGHHVTEVWRCCVLASLPQPWELPLGNLSNPNHLPKARL